MGHANISITLDRYGHLMPGSEAEEARLLDAYLSAQRSGTKKPPARLARCLLAHNWRTETANRLFMRDRASQLGMYFI